MSMKVFVGSAGTSAKYAEALITVLDKQASTCVFQHWQYGMFPLGNFTLEALSQHLDETDFGIFFLAPDDLAIVKGKVRKVVRENVMLELGMWIGRMGKERALIVAPDGTDSGDLASDLAGVTMANYDPKKGDHGFLYAAREIAKAIKLAGPRPPLLPISLFDRLSRGLQNIGDLRANKLFVEGTEQDRTTLAYQLAHNVAYDLVELAWPKQPVDVSLKLPDPAAPRKQLRCFYLPDKIKQAALRGLFFSEALTSIPINGTAAGEAYKKGKVVFVDDATSDEARKRFPELKKLEDAHNIALGSIVASPLLFEGKPLGVVKFDAPKPGFFQKSDHLVNSILAACVLFFDTAFQIAQIGASPSRTLPKPASAKRSRPPVGKKGKTRRNK